MPYGEGEARSRSMPARIEDENPRHCSQNASKKKKAPSYCVKEREKKGKGSSKASPLSNVRFQSSRESEKKSNFVNLGRTLRMGCAATQPQECPRPARKKRHGHNRELA
jgi:hypothetical protein